MHKILVTQYERNRNNFNRFIKRASLEYLRDLSGADILQLAIDKLYSPGVPQDYQITAVTIRDTEDYCEFNAKTVNGLYISSAISYGTCSHCDVIDHLRRTPSIYTREAAKTLILHVFENIKLSNPRKNHHYESDQKYPDISPDVDILGNPDHNSLNAVTITDATPFNITGQLILYLFGSEIPMHISGIYVPDYELLSSSKVSLEHKIILSGKLLSPRKLIPLEKLPHLLEYNQIRILGYNKYFKLLQRTTTDILIETEAKILTLLSNGDQLLEKPKVFPKDWCEPRILVPGGPQYTLEYTPVQVCGDLKIGIGQDILFKMKILDVGLTQGRSEPSKLSIRGHVTRTFLDNLLKLMNVNPPGGKLTFVMPPLVNLHYEYPDSTIYKLEIWNSSDDDQLKIRLITDNFLKDQISNFI